MKASVAAIDLGATSGRVIVGHVDSQSVAIHVAARFPNNFSHSDGGLRWDAQNLRERALAGLRAAATWDPAIASVGIDSWAVDYGLLKAGALLGDPFHYRDDRTAIGVERVHAQIDREALFARNGLQFLPFNTLYQLAAEVPATYDAADTLLLVPDLIGHYLSGARVTERTNASTTGLLSVTSGDWDAELMALLGLRAEIMTALVDAGTRVAALSPSVTRASGLAASTELIAVGSHDTASAIVGTPMTDPGAAYISCGTWGLVGVETEAPVLNAAARDAGFTNEGGVDGRTRFLHNVMGLWLLTECMNTWDAQGAGVDLQQILGEAASVGGEVAVFDTNDARLMPPGDMPARIAQICAEANLPVPQSRAEFVRSILESLAAAFASATHTAAALTGSAVNRIHLTGGGSQNELLCQLTANRAGLPVLAGPVEATAIGNLMVQARTLGAVQGSLESLRAVIGGSFELREYRPKDRMH